MAKGTAGRNDLVATAGLVAAILSSVGCAVRRELVVLSEPSGAAVRLDQQIVGVTPFHTEFEAFGTRRVSVYHEGYRAWSKPVKLVAPWYARFPFDFVSEVLLPFGWTYTKEVRATLEPEGGLVTEPDLDAILQRAEDLRKAGPEGPQGVRTPPQPE